MCIVGELKSLEQLAKEMAQFLIITEFEDANDFLMPHAFKQQAFMSVYMCL